MVTYYATLTPRTSYVGDQYSRGYTYTVGYSITQDNYKYWAVDTPVICYYHAGRVIFPTNETTQYKVNYSGGMFTIDYDGTVSFGGNAVYTMEEGDIAYVYSYSSYRYISVGKPVSDTVIYIHGNKLNNNLYPSYNNDFVAAYNELPVGSNALLINIGYRFLSHAFYGAGYYDGFASIIGFSANRTSNTVQSPHYYANGNVYFSSGYTSPNFGSGTSSTYASDNGINFVNVARYNLSLHGANTNRVSFAPEFVLMSTGSSNFNSRGHIFLPNKTVTPSVSITNGDTTTPVTLDSGNVASYGATIIPSAAGDYTVNVYYQTSNLHNITLSAQSGGTASVSAGSAAPGETITVTCTPNSGASVDTVTARSGDTVLTVTKVSDTIYTFVMPDGDVIVGVYFTGGGYTEPTEPVTPGGGGTTRPDGVISIPVPTYPTSHALSTNFVTAWKVTDSLLGQLHSYLFGETFADGIKQVLASPMDSIVSLHMLPMTSLPVSESREITLGNMSSGVSATPLSSQYMTVLCGEVSVPLTFKSYLDYEPYTKVSIYLPYIGVRTVNADLVVNRTIGVTYNVDLMTGDCIASIYAKMEDGNTLIGYHEHGNCAMHIPITGRDVSGQLMGALGTFSQVVRQAATGNIAGAMMSAMPTVARAGAWAGATLAGGYSGQITGGDVANVMGGKPDFTGSTISGNAGFMDVQKPYLIVERPQLSMPANYEQVEGFPSNVWSAFSELSGYTRVGKCVLKDMGCTDTELDEIYSLLTSGVIF